MAQIAATPEFFRVIVPKGATPPEALNRRTAQTGHP